MEVDYSSQNPRQYFDKNGYFIFKGLIKESDMNALQLEYENTIKPSKRPFFRQSTNRWEKNRFNEYGYAQSSFLDIHDYVNSPVFSEQARRLFCSPELRRALVAITGEQKHNLMQSMLFDQNTATPPHQDHYYLDSVPNGRLVAAWIALEDIEEKAGRFFVIPGSNKERFILTENEKISNHLYTSMIKNYVSQNKEKIFAPALKRGDAFFWHAYTVHGSLPTIDRLFSRKSLTAHYMPEQFEFGNMYNKSFSVQYGLFEGMKYRKNERIYSISNSLKYEVWNFLDKHPTMRKIVNQIKGELFE
jgi:phytanoyl-CoA hydroxylase